GDNAQGPAGFRAAAGAERAADLRVPAAPALADAAPDGGVRDGVRRGGHRDRAAYLLCAGFDRREAQGDGGGPGGPAEAARAAGDAPLSVRGDRGATGERVSRWGCAGVHGGGAGG